MDVFVKGAEGLFGCAGGAVINKKLLAVIKDKRKSVFAVLKLEQQRQVSGLRELEEGRWGHEGYNLSLRHAVSQL